MNLLYLLQVTDALNSQNKNTAILFFTRSAQQEGLSKNFSGIHKTHFNTKVAEHLIAHTQKTIRRSGLPCFTVDSNHQHGNTFGERLGNAIEEIFDLGYKNIISVGNDCPNLSVHHLIHSKIILDKGFDIFGPDSHGGAYLIGVTKKSFNKNDFINLPWETNILFNSLKNLLKNIYLLHPEHDLNYTDDVKVLLQSKAPSSIIIFLQSIIASLGFNNKKLIQKMLHQLIAFFFSIKAPPISI